MQKIEEINSKLAESGYFSNNKINTALFVMMTQNKPLLIEGHPGVGKTALAKAVADAYGYDFIRVQMYEGLTSDKLLYDYDYQKQLLTIEMIKPALEKALTGKDIAGAAEDVRSEVANFYGRD